MLLGAGYDCRALRMPELADARVFEVDHPATQTRKRRSARPARRALAVALPDLGLRDARRWRTCPTRSRRPASIRRRPTFTIWEGVTMYLTDAAIDASLRAIRAWSARGSQLAMTYFAKSRITQPSLITRAMKAVVRHSASRGVWLGPEQLPGYLAERGFKLVKDIALSDAARDLLPADLARTIPSPDRRVHSLQRPKALQLRRELAHVRGTRMSAKLSA